MAELGPNPHQRFKRAHDTLILNEVADIEDLPAPQKQLSVAISDLAYRKGPSRYTSTRSKKARLEAMEVRTANPRESALTTGSALKVNDLQPSQGSAIGRAAGISKKSKSIDSPSRKKPIQMELKVPHDAPHNWQEVYELIKQMRKGVEAPVDTMGCAAVMKDELDPKTQRFGTLVSLMLSSQTKDEVTAQALANLRSTLPGGLTIEGVLAADDELVQNAICKVGFWRRKTVYIRQTAQRLKDDFDSEVPQTVDELCSLPGVGPKMAFLVLQVAWNLNLGIGVDVHVHRITNRLGWHKKATVTPEQTRLNLQSWLPKSLHGEINTLLVGFGQTICLPVGPKCQSCLLSERGLCPSAKRGSFDGRAPVKGKGKADSVAKSVDDLIGEEGLVKMEGAEDV